MQLRIVLSAAVLLSLTAAAHADTVYTYTGNDFTYATSPYTTSDSVSGTLTLASALSPNTSVLVAGPNLISFSFTDGINTITNTTANLAQSVIDLETDASGNITQWDLNFSTADPSHPGYYAEIIRSNGASAGEDSAYYEVALSTHEGEVLTSGSWTSAAVAPSPAPEPNTLLLLGSGMLGLAAFARRRFA